MLSCHSEGFQVAVMFCLFAASVGVGCFLLSSLFRSAGSGKFQDRLMKTPLTGIPWIFLLLAISCSPAVFGMYSYSEMSDACRADEAKAIVADARGWIAKKISSLEGVGVPGTVVVVDKQIDEIKGWIRHSGNQKSMLYGNAIGALERERECLARMRGPGDCR